MAKLIGGPWDGKHGDWTYEILVFPVREDGGIKEVLYQRQDDGDYLVFVETEGERSKGDG